MSAQAHELLDAYIMARAELAALHGEEARLEEEASQARELAEAQREKARELWSRLYALAEEEAQASD